jgi:hypothetical protein
VSKFGSQTLVQICLEIGENSIQSGALGTVLSRSACTARHRVAPRRVVRAHRGHPMGPNAEAAYHPSVRAPWDRPRRTAVQDPLPVRHVLMPATPANQRRRRRTRAAPPPTGYWPSPLAPPLPHAATRGATTPVTPPQGTHAYKGVNLTAARLAPHRAAITAAGGAPGELHLRLHFFATRAAPHSTRTPCSSCTSLLACPSRRLIGASVPAAAAGQPSASSALSATPSQPTHRSPSLGYLEALCVAHCPAPPVPSPGFAPPRPCSPGAAAATHRWPLRPSYHRQPPRGEPNIFPRRLFATLCSTSPPASSPSPPGSRGARVWL